MSGEQNFSARLVALREKFGLTQTELAAELKLSMSYIHQLESGKRTASDSTVRLVELWAQMREMRRASAACDHGPSVVNEAGFGYAADLIPPNLRQRVERVADRAHVTPRIIIESTLEQFLQRAEKDGTITLHLNTAIDPPDAAKKAKGAA